MLGGTRSGGAAAQKVMRKMTSSGMRKIASEGAQFDGKRLKRWVKKLPPIGGGFSECLGSLVVGKRTTYWAPKTTTSAGLRLPV